MNVLVLGGTVFLGRAVVAELSARGHVMTTFTRGVHSEDGAPPARRLHGDRQSNLHAIPSDGWDAVVDTSGYRPEVVRASVERLRAAGRYVFVSTVSVYDATEPSIDESSALEKLADGADLGSPQAYGPLKAACEDVVRDAFGRRAVVVRPGLIAGPYDPTDRVTYWPERAARGGAILAPGPPERPVQLIDVRDVAGFIVHALERRIAGTFNVTGRPNATTMHDVIEASRDVTGVPSKTVWVDDQFLESHGVTPWTELPLWIPESAGAPGLLNVDVSRALAAGLTTRPLRETLRDTLTWSHTRPAESARRAGLSAEREAALLRAWAA